MHIRYGYTVELLTSSETAITAIFDVHPDRRGDITQPDEIEAIALVDGSPIDVTSVFSDTYGNLLRRFAAPAGGVRLSSSGVIFDSGFGEPVPPSAAPAPASELPADVLPFMLASPCCPTDLLMDQAWSLFRHVPDDERIPAICEYVQQKLRPSPGRPMSAQTAVEALDAGAGEMKDFAHAAIAFCRCMNIPARFCSGYSPVPLHSPGRCEGAFCSWFECYLEGAWWTFDARQEDAPIARVLVARGRDASDAPPISGDCDVLLMDVVAEAIEGARYPATAQDRREHWQSRGDGSEP